MKLTAQFSITLLIAVIFAISCNNAEKAPGEKADSVTETPAAQPEVHGAEVNSNEIELKTPLVRDWVLAGQGIYEIKCQGCHKLTDERVVGPGWKDVTKRRKPEWIMNMITNVDMMLEKDPEAQKLLEQCLVRMPNQNISREEAREILEFMRSNDGEK
jgi:cytochrome c2